MSSTPKRSHGGAEITATAFTDAANSPTAPAMGSRSPCSGASLHRGSRSRHSTPVAPRLSSSKSTGAPPSTPSTTPTPTPPRAPFAAPLPRSAQLLGGRSNRIDRTTTPPPIPRHQFGPPVTPSESRRAGSAQSPRNMRARWCGRATCNRRRETSPPSAGPPCYPHQDGSRRSRADPTAQQASDPRRCDHLWPTARAERLDHPHPFGRIVSGGGRNRCSHDLPFEEHGFYHGSPGPTDQQRPLQKHRPSPAQQQSTYRLALARHTDAHGPTAARSSALSTDGHRRRSRPTLAFR